VAHRQKTEVFRFGPPLVASGPPTCDDPSTCDEIVPNTAGAADTPPFPWQNRGTYHQIDEISGHR
jgi:hypothetical protein